MSQIIQQVKIHIVKKDKIVQKQWPNTKDHYQSDIDLFLQTFNKNRTMPDPSREKEKEQAALIAHKRDKIIRETLNENDQQ